ncbi:nitrous oxide reductase accessory protein NosL [Cognaticolwellia beringensis]|uniref:Nitrous oxide reductase accessory protein NosL n=1 Tax=Cognaticolwellia beringensis TaxID=1967665 RepID=A0A222G6X1_9GAMM|nr:nitrous oxide reductase accessory protein NosL [Cognaticolwellia beringensis]ASP47492.1 nitrous oxide reductase accessory protein NosL [Cognaticolwellia beringensis]
MQRKVFLLLVLFAVFSCSEQSEQQKIIHQAVTIESADECHLCGMLISNFSGPKAELFRKGVTTEDNNRVKKFCSTRDMFSFYLDPENNRNVTTILVHDMSKAPWDSPNDSYFIDARLAWYVVGSNLTGAMGKTLASFSTKTDADTFASEFGGNVIDFNAVNYQSLQ